jgi:hypothetical protein
MNVSEKISNYVQRNLDEYKVFIHFTSLKQNADCILKEGFKYSETIYKTSQEIINSSVDLTYKLQLYRPYGSFLILLCVPKQLVEIFNQYKTANHSFSLLDNVLSELNPKNDLEYTLPPMFVRGYVDMDKNVITENKWFLNDFNIEDYRTKLQNTLNP